MLALAAVVLASLSATSSNAQDAAKPAVVDVVAAVEALRLQSSVLTFAADSSEFPHGGHLQGIQMRFDAARDRYVVFLSHDSDTEGYLVAVALSSGLTGAGQIIALHRFASDGKSPPLRHAGGMQLAGDVLAVGLEDNQLKTRSEVQFWDVADPTRIVPLAHLTIRRHGEPKDKTAGAVGIVKRGQDHLVAVAIWDSRAIDFYASNHKPLADQACRFEPSVRWHADGADKTAWQGDTLFGAYQAINLITQADGRLFLLGFETTVAGQDVVDLFAVELDQVAGQAIAQAGPRTARASKREPLSICRRLFRARRPVGHSFQPTHLRPRSSLDAGRSGPLGVRHFFAALSP